MMSWILLLPLLQNIHMRCKNTPMLATCHSPLSGPGSGPDSGSGTETVKRPSAVQDVNFAAKRDAQRVGGESVVRGRKRGKLAEEKREKREERRGMNVVGWLVIDAGDKEAVARVKFRAGSGPVSSSASSSACHRCSRSECNKMLPIVFGRSVVFYCFCFFCCCSLFSLLFRLLCVCVLFFSLCLLPTLLRVRARRADCGSRPSIS